MNDEDWFDRHPWMYAIAPALPGLVALASCLFWWWLW